MRRSDLTVPSTVVFGQQIPRPKTASAVHRLDNKRLKNLGPNAGGEPIPPVTGKKDSDTTFVNPLSRLPSPKSGRRWYASTRPYEFREQKTYQEFITEAKKKSSKKKSSEKKSSNLSKKELKAAFRLGQQESPTVIHTPPTQNQNPAIDVFDAGAPNSQERLAAIKAMKKTQGGGAIVSDLKQREKDAIKRITERVFLQKGEDYGHPEYQKRLAAEKERKKKEKEAAYKARQAELYKERKTKGIYGYYKNPETGTVERGWRRPDGTIDWTDS